jgi:drug/metabolite transporter (DMT)-like permease
LGSFGWVVMSKAYKNAPAAAVAPFHYSQMLMGALLGFLIWGDVPNRYLIGGACIIIASGIYLVRHERRVSRMMVRAD